VLKDNAKMVDSLLKSGAKIDIKAKDVFGSTPLLWAAFWGVQDMVPLLVERGARLDAIDVLGSHVTVPLWADERAGLSSGD
jgi:ankyrin repeat protein